MATIVGEGLRQGSWGKLLCKIGLGVLLINYRTMLQLKEASLAKVLKI